VVQAAGDGLDLAAQEMRSRRERLAREGLRPLAPWASRLAACETQARLLDPARLLRRGYTITLGPGGQTISSVAGLAAGDRLTTVLADGRLQSIIQPGDEAGLPGNRKAQKRGGKKGKTDAGQKALFR
jgi:exodeoxyribonuclease VII large subunit